MFLRFVRAPDVVVVPPALPQWASTCASSSVLASRPCPSLSLPWAPCPVARQSAPPSSRETGAAEGEEDEDGEGAVEDEDEGEDEDEQETRRARAGSESGGGGGRGEEDEEVEERKMRRGR